MRELLGFTLQSNSRYLIAVALGSLIERRSSVHLLGRLTRRYESSGHFLVVTTLRIAFKDKTFLVFDHLLLLLLHEPLGGLHGLLVGLIALFAVGHHAF